MGFDFVLSAAGTKGGQSTSKPKADAARRNGAAGGRPRTRLLVDWLMRRKLTPAQRGRAQVAAGRLDNNLLGKIKSALAMPGWDGTGYFFDVCATDYRIPHKLGPGTSARLAILRAYIRAEISGKI